MTRLVFLAAALLVACDTTTELDPVEVIDGMDEPFLGVDGKSDVSGIGDDMSEGRAILLLLNSTPEATLAEAFEWPVYSLENLLSWRHGEDGTPGTADDRHFADLAALDAVPYIGPRTFSRLLAYVQNHGVTSVVRFEDSQAYSLAWPQGGAAAPETWMPELSRMRLHIDTAPNGAVQISFVGDTGTWFVFQGTMSATGHIEADCVQNPLQALSGAHIKLDPIYPDRFCASFTGSVNLGSGAVPFDFAVAAKTANVAAFSCP